MRVLLAIGAVILLLLLAVPVSLRLRTLEQIKRIEALKGHVGSFSELSKPIRTRYQLLESGQQLDAAMA